VVIQKNNLLLRFFKLRLIVNGSNIYSLVKGQPIVVNIPTNPSRIVVTDGYHITQPFEIEYSHNRTYYYKIGCGIEDDQLIFGTVIIILLYAMGSTSGMILLQLLSLAPIFYFLFLYYINRKEFIKIRPA
jgi:hypothetical protein